MIQVSKPDSNINKVESKTEPKIETPASDPKNAQNLTPSINTPKQDIRINANITTDLTRG